MSFGHFVEKFDHIRKVHIVFDDNFAIHLDQSQSDEQYEVGGGNRSTWAMEKKYS